MNEFYHARPVAMPPPQSNGVGLAGLIFSILGWLTCGVLCVPGVILSIIGMQREPKGTAVAGLIVGLPGVIGMFIAIAFFIAGMAGIKHTADRVAEVKAEMEAKRAAEVQPLGQPSNTVE